jgi:hypothetical protein
MIVVMVVGIGLAGRSQIALVCPPKTGPPEMGVAR